MAVYLFEDVFVPRCQLLEGLLQLFVKLVQPQVTESNAVLLERLVAVLDDDEAIDANVDVVVAFLLEDVREELELGLECVLVLG